MSCERMGHHGSEDHHNEPRFRCLYCGRWGYSSTWYDEDKEEYENCECDLSYEEHREKCD